MVAVSWGGWLNFQRKLNIYITGCASTVMWKKWFKLVDWFYTAFHGVSLFYDKDWIPDKLDLWTDVVDWGIGCLLRTLYISEPFSQKLKSMSIAWRELYAIVVACATWRFTFSGKCVIFNCDNEAIVFSIVSGVSKNVEIITLIRMIFFICSCCNFECSAVYLPSKMNVLAAALSRNDIKNFRKNCNLNNMQRCKPVDILSELHNYR